MSQGGGRWLKLERLHSSRDGTWAAGEQQVPTQGKGKGKKKTAAETLQAYIACVCRDKNWKYLQNAVQTLSLKD